MQLNENSVDLDLSVNDLGPLAWVLDELRKSLDGAIKALRRFVRDADLALGSDLAALDTSHLRIARQQLHQAEGALEMVGLGSAAGVLRAMEAVAQRFVQRPELCTHEQAEKVERASFALVEYLEAVLRSKPASPVSLFPQYRDLQEIVGAERIHPADLWPVSWRWLDVSIDPSVAALGYDDASRSRFDRAMLQVIKTGDRSAAKRLKDLCLGFAAAQSVLQPRTFWTLCAAYFEGLAAGGCPNDVYVKRTSSRVLTQYIALMRADLTQADRLARDLLFFCVQAAARLTGLAPTLSAVLQAYGLQDERKAVDYETRLFGRFDPAALSQARKRIGVAKETWASLSGGDTQKLKTASDQFSLVSDSLIKLDSANQPLARALTRAMDMTLRSGHAPTPQVAMEVATAVLFLEAAYDEVDPEDTQMAVRSTRLAQRLDRACDGAEPEALESWMEELYRRVSERQTMGSVVSELGVTMGLLEKSMDQFFRNPQDKTALQHVPGQLAQMRGVLSLLGLDQASMAVMQMRDSVEQILVDEVDAERARAAGTFERLGNSLGALGFMVDMLNYQPALAKKMFVFDQAKGEFRSVMGRAQTPLAPVDSVHVAPVPEELATPTPLVDAAPIPSPVQLIAVTPPEALPEAAPVALAHEEPVGAMQSSVVPAATGAPPAADDEELELREIFLEEAREVLETGLATLDALAQDPADISQQTTLRRTFHTLKGSSRMVGLTEYGEAAWSLEQLFNGWIAEQKPVSDDLRAIAGDALRALEAWAKDIGVGADAHWKAEPFRVMADAMRTQNRRLPLVLAHGQAPSVEIASEPTATPAVPLDLSSASLALPEPVSESPTPVLQGPTASPPASGTLEFADIDFDALSAVSEPTEPEADATPTIPAEPETAALVAVDVDFESLAPEPASEAVEVQELFFDEPVAGVAVDSPAEPQLEPEPEPEPEEEVKVIGSLRIGIPLYNVYLNEADEWSRRLVTELAEWAMELPKPVSDSTVALAHSLAGASATVGFTQLSSVARDLEQALGHVRLLGRGTAWHGQVFADAAQDIRRLLHQFAAGFIKDADPHVVQALKDVRDVEVADFTDTGGDGASRFIEELAVSAAHEAPVPEPEAEPPTSVFSGLHEAVVSSALLTPIAAIEDGQADEIDVEDAVDVDLFPIFEEEALGLLPGLAGALRQWSARPDNLGARAEVLRGLHTLKGSARLAGAMRLGEMAHRLESSIESLGSEGLQSSQVEPLLNRLDDLQNHFDALRSAEEAALTPEPAAPAAPVALEVPAPTQSAESAPVPPRLPVAMAAALASVSPRTLSHQSIRVRPQLLDRLVNQAGEVMMTRSRLEEGLSQLGGSLDELTGNLDRLRQQLRDIELQAETQMQSRLALSKESASGFDPLEFDRFTRVQELTRMMAESVNDVATVQRNLQRAVESTEDSLVAQARQTRELQRDLLRTRMVEFENITERLYGVVRQAGKDAGKQVRLDIVGGSIELDRSVLDRMTPAFEHLLRNCVGHGIEDAATRAQAGKDATGSITIRLGQEGNDVSVEFEDDGGGLDLGRIREKAVSMGLVAADAELTQAMAADLIFMPGFSTASQVTELAGRGIGMDVVRAEVSALGGRIETVSESGKGTRFKLILPLTTAVTQVVLLRAGNLTIGVPANLIETVRRVKPAALELAYSTGQFDDGAGNLPFFWSGALLQASARSLERDAKTLSIIICRSAGQRIAMHVDEVLGNQEVVVKNLGAQLARLPGLAAMTVLASGAVVLVYNPVALATVYGEQARLLSAEEPVPGVATHAVGAAAQAADTAVHARLPLVLVVDDSITVRRVTQRLLLREGYRVALAVDGLQALERLQEELPTVVLTDIEMPRMDGFDLARNIRGDERMRDLPIIMITSRIADKHRQHAVELGVNHYLGKPYPEEELLNLVRHYCAVEEAA